MLYFRNGATDCRRGRYRHGELYENGKVQIIVRLAPPNERPRLLRPRQANEWRHMVPDLQEQRHQAAAAEGQFLNIEGDEVPRTQSQQITQLEPGRGVSYTRNGGPRRAEFYRERR